MPYNPDIHAGVGYIDKPYKVVLQKLHKKHKRDMKSELEYMIEREAKEAGIPFPKEKPKK